MIRDRCWFFFSSRRRHTRYWRDWSSDVCSSDLPSNLLQAQRDFFGAHTYERVDKPGIFHTEWLERGEQPVEKAAEPKPARSEERRVGKECRSRWSQYH